MIPIDGTEVTVSLYKDEDYLVAEARWEHSYKEGKRHGRSYSHMIARDGTLASSSDVQYQEGKRHGLAIEISHLGSKTETNYKQGRKHGLFRGWYPNGQQSAEYTFVEGEPQGVWSFWSPDGEEVAQLSYRDGVPWEGVAMHWSLQGHRSYESEYREGHQLYVREWDEDGVLEAEQAF